MSTSIPLLFKKFIRKILPGWSKNTAFIVAGIIIGVSSVAFANPGHIVQKSLSVVGVDSENVDKPVTNSEDNSSEKHKDSTKKADDNPTTNTPGATPSNPSSSETTPRATPSNPSSSETTPNTPGDLPPVVVGMTLKGIEGLVPTVHVGQPIYVPAITPSEATFSVQWRVRTGYIQNTGEQIDEIIPGATSNPYYPSSTYLNKWITCVITGTNGWTGSLPCPTNSQVIN